MILGIYRFFNWRDSKLKDIQISIGENDIFQYNGYQKQIKAAITGGIIWN